MVARNIHTVLKVYPQELLSLEEVKNYLRISDSYDDKLINNLVVAAINAAENFIGLNCIKKLIKFTGNAGGISIYNKLQLKYKPIYKVEEVILHHDNKDRKLLAEDYYCDSDYLYLKCQIASNQELEVQYITGYDQEHLPQSIKYGVLLHVADMYNHNTEDGQIFSASIRSLYFPHRMCKI